MQVLVREVCTLWHEQSVTLKTRARFWVGFRGREDHFWATEHRRLSHMAARLRSAPLPEQSPRSHAVAMAAHRAHERAQRALKVGRVASSESSGCFGKSTPSAGFNSSKQCDLAKSCQQLEPVGLLPSALLSMWLVSLHREPTIHQQLT